MKKVIAATLLATIIGLAGAYQVSASCGDGMRGTGDFFGGGMRGMAQLDDATKVKFDQFLADTQDIRRKMAVKRAEIRALMHSSEPDAGKVGELSGQLFDLRVSMRAQAKKAGLGDVMRAAHEKRDCDGSGYHHGRRGGLRGQKGSPAN